jgi:hypothetical protein
MKKGGLAPHSLLNALVEEPTPRTFFPAVKFRNPFAGRDAILTINLSGLMPALKGNHRVADMMQR